MYSNKFHEDGNDYNDCVARGNCSAAPDIKALQEVVFSFLSLLAYYEIKQTELNISYYDNMEVIMETVPVFINAEKYSNIQLLEVVSKVYSKLLYARKEYLNFCNENNIECKDIKPEFKLTPKMTLSEIIKLGDKSFLANYRKVTAFRKNLSEILVIVIKSAVLNLSKLKSFDKSDDDVYFTILECLCALNNRKYSNDELIKYINKLTKANCGLLELISNAQYDKFGKISELMVSKSTEPGKALLVSGSNLNVLYDILDKTSDADFSVYTHSDLIIAHAYEKFKQFKHLKGDYGSCRVNCILDFATFPGPIVLTESNYPNIDYLYRGKVFSTENITPKGVIKVDSSDYSEIFDSIEISKGFSKGRQMPSVEAGYNEETLKSKIADLSQKIKNNEIKHVVVIGMADYSSIQESYYKKLFTLLPQDTFIVTFSYHSDNTNQLYINLGGNIEAVYRVMKLFFDKLSIASDILTFFFTKCDINSLSTIINLSNSGAKNIFLSQCPPFIINPDILSALKNVYQIQPVTTPENDIQKIIK